MTAPRIAAGKMAPGEYAPAGEAQGLDATFSADQVAAAFEVAIDRVHRALAGEYGLGPEGRIDSKRAQELAELILGDQALDIREAALMKLGAFTPRADQAWGMGETAPGEESDRFAASADVLEDEHASPRGSYDESQRVG
ncbi:MAG: hypothetical protein AVDCRST_MAG19-4421 [uncultured Thermomicrobiales bacterium]|uniref:Uncharacterized protein n=1 Tax=uncultured Thermomicrobiales bacterium TaxID=1645740 RepID=A0A6J4VSS1_9BACT|nr:MAG: hypothetical protein AVDCRST_MAG19-4421 [uncultured Thermomicrobiales bacterium]